MGFAELFLLAVGLSMDAFAVSICKGLSMKKATLKAGAICGAWFGGFQALMPLIGFFLGSMFAGAIEAFDHWVAFGLLAVIGINMLKEAFCKCEECENTDADLSAKAMFIRFTKRVAPLMSQASRLPNKRYPGNSKLFWMMGQRNFSFSRFQIASN